MIRESFCSGVTFVGEVPRLLSSVVSRLYCCDLAPFLRGLSWIKREVESREVKDVRRGYLCGALSCSDPIHVNAKESLSGDGNFPCILGVTCRGRTDRQVRRKGHLKDYSHLITLDRSAFALIGPLPPLGSHGIDRSLSSGSYR